jgi:hypothetical protein
MTIYDEGPGTSRYISLLRHEIGHLMGMKDRYFEQKDANGDRYTPPRPGWENNIMGDTYNGRVEARNIFEALYRRVNRKIFSD